MLAGITVLSASVFVAGVVALSSAVVSDAYALARVSVVVVVSVLAGIGGGVKAVALWAATEALPGSVAFYLVMFGVVALMVLSDHIGWYSLQEKEEKAQKYTVLRSTAVTLATVNGTNFYTADLTNADFSGARLKNTNFSKAALLHTRWFGAKHLEQVLAKNTYLRWPKVQTLVRTGNGQGKTYSDVPELGQLYFPNLDLSGADLRNLDLSGAKLRGVKLRDAKLNRVKFHGADLHQVDLRGATLCQANFHNADLSRADLSGSDLQGAHFLQYQDLSGVKLIGSNLTELKLDHLILTNADLSEADLSRVQALGTQFRCVDFTGACIEDWNINPETNFEGAICKYVYRQSGEQKRWPSVDTFESADFAVLIQKTFETIDLIFREGIDWQAFLQAFQNLRRKYSDKELNIQSIEEKGYGLLCIRLGGAEGITKPLIEEDFAQFYKEEFKLLEQLYRDGLKAKDGEILAYREQSANLMKITELLGSKIMPSEINQTFNASVGNNAVNNHGTMSAIQNNYGPNTEDITCLLTALRAQAQTFPTDQKDDANDVLDDLERDLKEEQPDQGRIGRRLQKLVALAAAIGTIVSGAAAVSGDVSTFTGNVIELTEKLGIPIEQVQLPSSGTP
ncbi:MAG: pentapeptide repeat-containing protein [Cyanobacteria bacterium J06649_12]